MGKKYLETDRAIDSLLPTKSKIKHPISKGTSTFLIQTPTSKRFVWVTQYPKKSGRYVEVRWKEWNNNVNEFLASIKKAKEWHEKNPNKHPRKFFNPKVKEEQNLSLKDAYKKYWTYYKKQTKPKTWLDRKNKWIQILEYFGENIPLSDFEVANGGEKLVGEMQEKLFFERGKYSQGKRTRQVLKGLFDYAKHPHQKWITTNPASIPHLEEKNNEKFKKRGQRSETNKHIQWSEVSDLLKTFGTYSDATDYRLKTLVTKAAMLMPFRVSAIAALEWSWYDQEKDLWIIPADTDGLKNEKGDIESDGLIPSTPEINFLMNKIKKITGNQKNIFWSPEGRKQPYITSGNINSTLMTVSAGKQTGHGWRKVFVEGSQVGGFPPHIIERCIGHKGHQGGAWGHYDKGKFLPERKKLMEWWSQELVKKGLVI
tara:strand:+ start:334 stop:1614 length:1281 start_codon:yes stop_codon:yes gene_type:complete